MPDCIETCTYLVAAAITGGRVRLTRTALPTCTVSKLAKPELKFRPARTGSGSHAGRRPKPRHQDAPYPAFPTDMKPSSARSTLSRRHGDDQGNDLRGRLQHVLQPAAPRRQDVDSGQQVIARGVDRLTGRRRWPPICVLGPARACRARSRRHDERRPHYHVDRGYERIETKLYCARRGHRRVVSLNFVTAAGAFFEHGFRLERGAVQAHDANRRCARRAARSRRGSWLAGDLNMRSPLMWVRTSLARKPAAAAGPRGAGDQHGGTVDAEPLRLSARHIARLVYTQVPANDSSVGDELLASRRAPGLSGNGKAQAFLYCLIPGPADDGRIAAKRSAVRVDSAGR